MFFLMVVSQMKTGSFQRHNISLQKIIYYTFL